MKKIFAAIVAASMVMAICAGCGAKDKVEEVASDAKQTAEEVKEEVEEAVADDGETIKIGIVAGVTGPTAVYGVAAQDGMLLAFDEINANGGILGKQVEVIKYDDKGDATESCNAFNKLDGEGVCAVLGPITSGVCAAVAPIANDVGLVMLTATGTADTLTTADDYVFRACFADSYQGKKAAQFAAQELGVKDVAILYASGDAYSAGCCDAFEAAAAEYGLNIVAKEGSATTDDTDFSAQLTTIANSGAEALFAPYYYNAVGPYIVPQAREAGFTGPIIGADGYDGTLTTMIEDKSIYNDIYFTNHYSPEDPSDTVQNFVKNFSDEYGTDYLNAFSALGYDAAYMLAQAIEEAGSTDRAAIRDAIAAINFSGVTGSFTLDETGTPLKSVPIITFKDGEQVFYTMLEN
ncbi:MAG: ABC transporter substrate-binding protein [Firmicutes bacterium]|nr:ABC transporter substrate-binding protein [Bacillota bacterium]